MYSTTMKKSLLRAISIGSIILSVLYFTNFALILHEIQDIEYSSNGIVENGLLPLLATTRNREELSNSTKVRRQQNRHDDVLSLHPTSSEAGIFKNGDWWNDKKSYYDPIIYDQLQKTALKPYRNVTTAAYPHGPFGGFRNQYMTFAGLILMVDQGNHSQIIVESVKWKDLFGTNQRLRHDLFFDVVHWNSFYPMLPRFVKYDSDLFTDVTFVGKTEVTPTIKWNVENISRATKPFAIGSTGLQAQNQYKQYVKRVVEGSQERHRVDLWMLRGAFRPHPALHSIMLEYWKKSGLSMGYMALHARIEPDMQKHNMCVDAKVTNITHIIHNLKAKFPTPPKPNILFIFNREILESEAKNENIDNALAKYNLDVIDNVMKTGLWNGRVRVHEAGVSLAKKSGHDIYSKYFSLSGSILDFFLAVQADIFIGTEVSSFSIDVEITRFYRGKRDNYHYVPGNIEMTTPLNVKHPPRFKC